MQLTGGNEKPKGKTHPPVMQCDFRTTHSHFSFNLFSPLHVLKKYAGVQNQSRFFLSAPNTVLNTDVTWLSHSSSCYTHNQLSGQ